MAFRCVRQRVHALIVLPSFSAAPRPPSLLQVHLSHDDFELIMEQAALPDGTEELTREQVGARPETLTLKQVDIEGFAWGAVGWG